jgi:hypothetical protein
MASETGQVTTRFHSEIEGNGSKNVITILCIWLEPLVV